MLNYFTSQVAQQENEEGKLQETPYELSVLRSCVLYSCGHLHGDVAQLKGPAFCLGMLANHRSPIGIGSP